MRKIYLRVDVDGYYGLKKGIANLLEIFEKYNIKATFFVNFGKESGLLKILWYRLLKGKSKKQEEIANVTKRYSKLQLARILLFPKWIGKKNCKILKEITSCNSEVEIHAFDHLRWTKDFENINKEEEIGKMVNCYYNCFKKAPKGFAPPGFRIDEETFIALKKFGIKYCSSSFGNKPRYLKKYSIWEFPLTLKYNLEELLCIEKNEEKVIRKVVSHVKNKKGYKSFYIHADFEGIKGINLFESLMKKLKGFSFETYLSLLSKLEK